MWNKRCDVISVVYNVSVLTHHKKLSPAAPRGWYFWIPLPAGQGGQRGASSLVCHFHRVEHQWRWRVILLSCITSYRKMTRCSYLLQPLHLHHSNLPYNCLQKGEIRSSKFRQLRLAGETSRNLLTESTCKEWSMWNVHGSKHFYKAALDIFLETRFVYVYLVDSSLRDSV